MSPSTPVRNSNVSPRTPSSTSSTPYTTSSGHSLPSSTLNTPSSISRSPKSNKSIADLAENWRERAQLSGIKVSAVQSAEDPQKAFLPSPSFTSSFRRTSKSSPFASPESLPRRSTRSTFNTPSSKPNIHQFLGSVTAPPEPRRRPAPFCNINEDDEFGGTLSSLRAFPDLSSLHETLPSPVLPDPSSSCSVCDKEPSRSSRMIVLSPCSHIFCASCFTGTLNIVGEKNMSCMECHSPVESFHFALIPAKVPLLNIAPPTATQLPVPLTESATVSTVPKSSPTRRNTHNGISVLRIDNVPWDVTPPLIQRFVRHPIIQAHVLLDVNGKTLSHAFVQLSDEDARAALRSTQNTILGKGRRARAVTVTLSSQDELMVALYPHWRGSFHGGEPSLNGLDNEQINETLEHGLISNVDLQSLLNLISTPNSHFLKVPSLPFYSLISILSTFPTDVDSRVFWSDELRDALFHVARTAFQVLASREQDSKEKSELWMKLVAAGLNCRAFTDSQIFELELLVKAASVSPACDVKPPVDLPAMNLNFKSSTRFDALADQFALHPNVLAAILQSSIPRPL